MNFEINMPYQGHYVYMDKDTFLLKNPETYASFLRRGLSQQCAFDRFESNRTTVQWASKPTA